MYNEYVGIPYENGMYNEYVGIPYENGMYNEYVIIPYENGMYNEYVIIPYENGMYNEYVIIPCENGMYNEYVIIPYENDDDDTEIWLRIDGYFFAADGRFKDIDIKMILFYSRLTEQHVYGSSSIVIAGVSSWWIDSVLNLAVLLLFFMYCSR
ncbi:hypothetical protein CDAR_534571 [Caerostris darwini]|uniref:Uncharacterized protein n=1 Tax=Caerostris darwini TaxID=1538125 RepID=A0AAV4MJB1_9ARAC|nr:hypothetical protein CDAR_534571 [Caerostris darwini]